MFLSNRGKWVIICSTILILMTLGAINLLSRDDKETLVVAEFHSDDAKELQINDDIRLKDPQPLETTSYSMSNEETKNLPKEIEHIDNKRLQEVSLLNNQYPEAKNSPKSSVLTSLPKVLKTAVCTDVKDKNPFGKAYSVQWSTNGIYVWNLIECETGLSSIRHIYYFKGKRVNDIALDIRSSRWRTWSYKALSDKRFIGTWRVDITSADGKLLESVQFEVS
jgi:hypothetical protein